LSSGIGFGDHSDRHVRFALISSASRSPRHPELHAPSFSRILRKGREINRQALRGIKQMLAKGVVPA
jgi:hypothetical protein